MSLRALSCCDGLGKSTTLHRRRTPIARDDPGTARMAEHRPDMAAFNVIGPTVMRLASAYYSIQNRWPVPPLRGADESPDRCSHSVSRDLQWSKPCQTIR